MSTLMRRAVVVAAAAALGMAPGVRAQDAPAPAGSPTPQGVQRRGWFGISLSCGDCFAQRGRGRVAYTRRPAIEWVEAGSPALQAGLRSGDTVVAVDGAAITTPEGFERFANATPGVAVRLTVRRGGESRDVTVTPSDNSASTTVAEFSSRSARLAQRLRLQALRAGFRAPLGWLGMGLECEQCSLTTFGLPTRGASFRVPPVVITVDVDGPAHRAGLRRGDTLIAIDGVDLTTPAGGRAFTAVEPGQRVTLTVRRGGTDRRVVLLAVARPDATPEELSAFQAYKQARDSSDAAYRVEVAASVAAAQAAMRQVEQVLREVNVSQRAADVARIRIGTMDSLVRKLRELQRRKFSESGFDVAFPAPAIAPRAIAAPVPPAVAVAPAPLPLVVGAVYPLRYSGRLADVANVEARAAGPVNASEVGDSLIVVTAGGIEVRVSLRPRR